MTTTCQRCTRINAPDANYCYFDGFALPGKNLAAAVPANTFATALVFPNGASCRTFEEFAKQCQARWSEAVDLLQKGLLRSFFGTLGRLDLVQASDEAAKFPDRDQGLDHLLSKLPANAVKPPRLEVKPPSVNLGALRVGQSHQFSLELVNAGGRLLSGSLSTDCKWLAPAENPLAESRLIQFARSVTIPIQIRSKQLRAGPKSLEGNLVLDTNAGTIVVRVVVDVPVQPFVGGMLAGARSPRELADKAKANPQAVAALFEDGSVLRWYQANGWTYPVQGPPAPGFGAVQQYFEALGLPKPQPTPGATSAAAAPRPPAPPAPPAPAWKPAPTNAPTAPAKPDALPSWLQGAPVPPPPRPAPPPPAPPQYMPPPRPAPPSPQYMPAPPVQPTFQAPPVRSGAPAPTPAPIEPFHAPAAPPRRQSRAIDFLALFFLMIPLFGIVASDFLRDLPKIGQAEIVEEPPEEKKGTIQEAAFKIQIDDEPDEAPIPVARAKVEDEPEERAITAPPPVKVDIKDEPTEGNEPAQAIIDPNPWVTYRVNPGNGHFGISTTGNAAGNAKFKQLTFDPAGSTNTTVVKINGLTRPLGQAPGNWTRMDARSVLDGITPTRGAVQPSHSTYGAPGGLFVHQILEVVPGQSTVVNGVARRLLDTVLIRWVFDNRDVRAHNVGLRLQLDTLIGSNDGVPFTVPNRPGLVNTIADFTQPKDVPDFVQALEIANINFPGTIAHLTAKVGGKLEAPDRLSLTYWPGGNTNWDIPLRNLTGDSAVILYWYDKQLPAGQTRTIGFGYGLGSVTSSNDKLALTLGGSFEPGQNFTATAYVDNPIPGQTLRLELPDGLSRLEGAETQQVPPAQGGGRATSIVTWKVQVDRTGSFRLAVHSSTGISQAKTISIARPEGPTGGKFALDLIGPFEPGQTFTVLGKVVDPVPDQTLTLTLPVGLELVQGDKAQKIPALKEATAEWKVKILKDGKFAVRVASSTGVTRTKTVTISQPDTRGNFKIALTGDFTPGKIFTIAAKVRDAVPNQKLSLQLPKGLERAEGDELQAVPPGAESNLAWKVKILEAGKFPIRVASTTGVTQRKTLVIEPPSDQAGRFSFELTGDIRPGKEFKVNAKVTDPVPGQSLKLVLPKELKLVETEASQKVAAAPMAKLAELSWRVQVVETGKLPIRVESSTGLSRTKTLTLTQSADSSLFGR